MQKQELPELAQRLSQLADALGGKAPSPAGLLVWGDALSECRFDDVRSALTDWPKSHQKMPTPVEILKICRTILSERLEAESKRNATFAPTVDKLVETAQDTPNARAFKRMWKAWKSRKVSSPREWCTNVLASDKADEELKAFAAASLAGMGDEKPARGRYWYEEEA